MNYHLLGLAKRLSDLAQDLPGYVKRGYALDLLDRSDTGRHELVSFGDSYRWMPFASFVKLLVDAGFEKAASFPTVKGVLHVYGNEETGMFASVDVVEGLLAMVTVQFRTDGFTTPDFRIEVFGLDHSTPVGMRDHVHVVYDATNGFTAKMQNALSALPAIPRWCNVDQDGTGGKVWLTHTAEEGARQCVRNLVSVADGATGEDGLLGLVLGLLDGLPPDPRPDGDEQEATLREQIGRLDALPPKWRDVADLDCTRKADAEDRR